MENKKTINIATKRLSELSPADYNPRKISDLAKRGLKKSIETLTRFNQILINGSSTTTVSVLTKGKCVTGERRWKRLKMVNESGKINL